MKIKYYFKCLIPIYGVLHMSDCIMQRKVDSKKRFYFLSPITQYLLVALTLWVLSLIYK